VDKAKLIFDSYAVSDKGRVRQLNEDRYLVAPRSGIWLVADGMGGHEAGEVASTAIVDHLATLGVASSAPDLRARFEDRIARANAEIWRIAQERGGTMGSTVAALLTFDGQFACIWLGDSRVYLVRDGRLSQISRDHTEVQELVDRGILTPAEARTWPRRNVITKAVGATEEIATDIELGHTRPGDIFVLGSDGLTAHVSDDEILQVSVDRDPESTCNTLLQMVLERGGTDNVTIIVVRCREEMPEELYERTFIQSGSAEA
jgi:protein phosphatase